VIGIANDDGEGGMVLIAPGKVSMGRDDGEDEKVLFAWDNEMPRAEGEVSEAFMVSSKAVSIGQFKAFVEDGGYEKEASWPHDFRYFESNGYKWPATWSKVGGEFYVHGPYGTHHWKEVKEDPVYVSLAEAMAYCKWFGDQQHQDQDQDHHHVMRIMTEEEYHRALDESDRSNGGHDAVVVMDLRSGGWEWTCSPFAGFPGFKAMEEYREYSADFFDGNHFVLKGSSPATHPSLHRDSFRNFYQRQYRYVFAKFRCCFTVGGSSGRC
jgi:formylglycine-generating enzyme required for sulfatase activity